MKKTLIIGGSGFIGSFLIKELDLKKSINFDKKQSPFFPEITILGNILDEEKLDKSFKDVDSVILLAAEHKDDVSPINLYYDVNVNGTKNVLKAMDKHKVKKLIFTSSVAVYGLNKDNPDENFEVDPFNHYGKSKWQAENEIKLWYKNNNDKSITIIRPTVVFGERNRGNVYELVYSKEVASVDITSDINLEYSLNDNKNVVFYKNFNVKDSLFVVIEAISFQNKSTTDSLYISFGDEIGFKKDFTHLFNTDLKFELEDTIFYTVQLNKPTKAEVLDYKILLDTMLVPETEEESM